MWNPTTYEKATFGGEWRIDCNRLCSLGQTGTCILGGGDNGSVYAWDQSSHWFIKQNTGHSDQVRSICAVDDATVVTGTASGDGSIIAWRSFTQ